MAVVHCRSVSN